MITLKLTLTEIQFQNLLYACREAAGREAERAIDMQQPCQNVFNGLSDNLRDQQAHHYQPQPEGKP